MIDAAASELLKQGLGYVLFILAGGVIVWQNKKLESFQDRCAAEAKQADKDLQAVNDQRLQEAIQIVKALERSAQADTERAVTIKQQSDAINDLTKGFAALVLTQEGARARFTELGQRLEGRQEEVLRTLHAILQKN